MRVDRILMSCVVGCSVLAAAACGSEGSDSEVTDPEIPAEVAAEVAQATDGEAREQILVAWRGRRAEIAAFLDQRSAGWEIVDTRRSRTGQLFDYVRAETLVRGAPDAPFAQPPPNAPFGADAGIARTLTEFDTDPSLAPPSGTIPVARPHLAPYEAGVVRARDLADYMELAWPHPAPAFVNNRLYGSHVDFRANTGTSGAINAWDYAEVASNEMSLLQTAALCWGANPGSTLEAIEVGLQDLPGLYGDSTVHLFTFFRTAGGATGDRVGGYNLTVQGFVQAAGAFPPGAAVGPFSTIDGTQYECKIEVQLFQNNWWVYACGVWIGYYPTAASASVPAGNRINFDLIGNGTCEIHWYGELFDAVPSTWTNADMGSGRFAAEGYGKAAYIREPFLLLAGGGTSWFSSAVPALGNGYDPDCYSVSSVLTNGGTGWGAYFFVGGPGGNNPGCN